MENSKQIAKVTKGLTTAAECREDTKLLMQPYINWEDYLTPAPMTIAILAELIFISSKDDFSIRERGPEGGFQYIKYPDSFRACLMQVCNSGWRAFDEAHKSMDQIRLYTDHVPTYITMAVKYLLQDDDQLVQTMLPDQLNSISNISDECLRLAESTEKMFTDVIQLISELLETCTNAKQLYGKELEEVKNKMEESKIRMQAAEEANKRADEAMENLSQQLKEAQDSFYSAMESMTGGKGSLIVDVIDGIQQGVSTVIAGMGSIVSGAFFKNKAEIVAGSQETSREEKNRDLCENNPTSREEKNRDLCENNPTSREEKNRDLCENNPTSREEKNRDLCENNPTSREEKNRDLCENNPTSREEKNRDLCENNPTSREEKNRDLCENNPTSREEKNRDLCENNPTSREEKNRDLCENNPTSREEENGDLCENNPTSREEENGDLCENNPISINNIYAKSTQILSIVEILSRICNGDRMDDSRLNKQESGKVETQGIKKLLKKIMNSIGNEVKCKTQCEGIELCKRAISVCSEIEKHDPKAKSDDAATKNIMKLLKSLRKDAMKFDMKSKAATNASAFPLKPPQMSQFTNFLGRTWFSNTHFRIEQSKAQLNKVRELYEKKAENQEKQHDKLSEILVTLQACKVKEIDFNTTIRILSEGLRAIGEVKEQWQKLVRFFQMVSNLMKTSVSTSLQDFVKTTDKASDKTLKYTSRMFLKDIIYQQAFYASDVASLVNMISGAYTEVSDKYLMDGVGKLASLMSMDINQPEFAQEREKMEDSCRRAQEGIRNLVKSTKKNFEEKTKERQEKIESGLKAVLPPEAEEEIREIQEAVQAGSKEQQDEDQFA